jgi:hypothetical protein
MDIFLNHSIGEAMGAVVGRQFAMFSSCGEEF